LTNSSSTYATVIYISEKISLAVTHDNTLGIRYFNKNNRDIFYKYGITHFVRIPFVSIVAKQKDDNEVNITDTSATVIESKVFEVNEFKFDVVTNEIMRKLVVALSCEHLFINNIGYVKDGNVETSNIQNTNLYEISVSLIKTGFSYDTIGGEIVGTSATGYDNLLQGRPARDEDYVEFNVPQIITDGTNFIKT
jgi:putative N-acetylmannosamine-6-phosphate epimerase